MQICAGNALQCYSVCSTCLWPWVAFSALQENRKASGHNKKSMGGGKEPGGSNTHL